MSDLLQDAYQRALAYQQSLDTRAVFPSPEALAGMSAFDEAMPLTAQSPQETLALLDTYGSPATVANTGKRYFGFVTGGMLPITHATNWLATTWDQNGALYLTSPIVAKIETVALRWLIDLFGFPEQTTGAFVSGATMANFTALAAARHLLLKRQGWDVEADGLFNAPEIKVVVGDEVHISVLKALSMLGFGRNRLIRVPVDEQGRMIPDQLPYLDAMTIVCIQSGNVNTGAFDPAKEICEKAHANGAWVHVDAAFGLWALASDELAPLGDGIALADSWTTDAHKWLNVPYDSGIVFCKHEEALLGAMSTNAAYLTASVQRDPANFVPEFSRCARAIDVWGALRTLGKAGISQMIAQNCALARLFADGLRGAGFSVLNDVVLNQVVVAFGDAPTTDAVIKAIQAEGTLWAGRTVWQGRTAMRISVSSWATTSSDVEQSLEAIIRVAKSIL
ncbi:MAG TPA: aminotransferase class V-fold PLP-dependent enzyme [Aggregatilineales bacterium]|nr:aminotransferase class V-fold PLP-dependent enzyme [Aggregatilineales bacterium]